VLVLPFGIFVFNVCLCYFITTTVLHKVNQRALIDKILARYASAGAVYRELLQNSNDANATVAEIYFTTSPDGVVSSVSYRNNGWPFRDQDWNRLKKIAEGNPDPAKIGAFGVGAYTMFSICEEPLVISGDQALAFVWKGDQLWTKTALNVEKKGETLAPGGRPWTTFVLPSRDPYPLPSMVEFAQFLCSSLTFTKQLHQIRVFVNEEERIFIQKTQIKEPTLVKPPTSSSWWKNDGAVTASSNGIFYLSNPSKSIYESIYQIDVLIDGDASSIQARYVSAVAKTSISSQMASRMERVTKKQPTKEVTVEIFLNAGQDEIDSKSTKNKADSVTNNFLPKIGRGRIFIGKQERHTQSVSSIGVLLFSSFLIWYNVCLHWNQDFELRRQQDWQRILQRLSSLLLRGRPWICKIRPSNFSTQNYLSSVGS
jgi:archaellum component FlaG (FlaF/FlaG flagellin family)